MTDAQQETLAAIQVEGYRKTGLSSWWNFYDRVAKFKLENGSLDMLPVNLKSWVHDACAAWRKGALEIEQLRHLKLLGIERNTLIGPKKTSKKLDDLRALRERVQSGQISDEDRKLYEAEVDKLIYSYNRGNLSPRTAREFGID